MKTVLVATLQCVGCQHQWTVRENEVAPDDYPLCPHCFTPGVLLKAERREIDTADSSGKVDR